MGGGCFCKRENLKLKDKFFFSAAPKENGTGPMDKGKAYECLVADINGYERKIEKTPLL